MAQASPFEQVPKVPLQSSPLESTSEILEVENTMQMELCETDSEGAMHWINTYSADFRDLISQEPDLLARFGVDHDGCMNYVQKKIEEIHAKRAHN